MILKAGYTFLEVQKVLFRRLKSGQERKGNEIIGVMIQEEKRWKKIVELIWPGIYRDINIGLYNLFRLIKSFLANAFHQIKGS